MTKPSHTTPSSASLSEKLDLWSRDEHEVRAFLQSLKHTPSSATPLTSPSTPASSLPSTPASSLPSSLPQGALVLVCDERERWWGVTVRPLRAKDEELELCVAWPDDVWLLSERELVVRAEELAWREGGAPLCELLCVFPRWRRRVSRARVRAPLAELSSELSAQLERVGQKRPRFVKPGPYGLCWWRDQGREGERARLGGHPLPARDLRHEARAALASLSTLSLKAQLKEVVSAFQRAQHEHAHKLTASLFGSPSLLGSFGASLGLIGGAVAYRGALKEHEEREEGEGRDEPKASGELSVLGRALEWALEVSEEGVTLALSDLTLMRAQLWAEERGEERGEGSPAPALSVSLRLEGADQSRPKPLLAQGVRLKLGHALSEGELLFERVSVEGQEGVEGVEGERSARLSWPHAL